MKAKFIRKLTGFTGDARLYELSEPVKYDEYDDKDETTKYVVVSATVALQYNGMGAETYIFPANEDGKVIDWGEMSGSFKGALDHSEAIKRAGWEEEK